MTPQQPTTPALAKPAFVSATSTKPNVVAPKTDPTAKVEHNPNLMDSADKPMTDGERCLWEQVVATCIGASADGKPTTAVVISAFAWADKALEFYRDRLAKITLAPGDLSGIVAAVDGPGQSGGLILVRSSSAGVTIPKGSRVKISPSIADYDLATDLTLDEDGKGKMSLLPTVTVAVEDGAGISFAVAPVKVDPILNPFGVPAGIPAMIVSGGGQTGSKINIHSAPGVIVTGKSTVPKGTQLTIGLFHLALGPLPTYTLADDLVIDEQGVGVLSVQPAVAVALDNGAPVNFLPPAPAPLI